MSQIKTDVQRMQIIGQVKKEGHWKVFANKDNTIVVAMRPSAIKYIEGMSLRKNNLYFSDDEWKNLFFKNIVGGNHLIQKTARILQYEVFGKLQQVGEYPCLLDIPVERFVSQAAHKNKKFIIRNAEADNYANFLTF